MPAPQTKKVDRLYKFDDPRSLTLSAISPDGDFIVFRTIAYQRSAATGCGREARKMGAPPAEPLVAEREGSRLVARLLRGDPTAILLKEELVVLTPASIVSLGLSPRESEVLVCAASGKTNLEIAAGLGVKPRTVHKHLERIYDKLGVRTRTAAAARAFEAARGSSARWSRSAGSRFLASSLVAQALVRAELAAAGLPGSACGVAAEWAEPNVAQTARRARASVPRHLLR